MAKKKKQQKKRKNIRNEYRPNYGDKKGSLYTFEDIEKFTSFEFTMGADNFEKKLSVAAAYTSDLLDMAKDNNVNVDLTLETQEAMFKEVLPKLVLFKRNQDNGDDWAREQLIKTIASYQLFVLCNFVNEKGGSFGYKGTLEYRRDSGIGLILVVSNAKAHKNIKFSPYAALYKVSEECFIFGDNPTEFAVSLGPFSKEVENELISKMADAIEGDDETDNDKN